jgi:hypothetical protein
MIKIDCSVFFFRFFLQKNTIFSFYNKSLYISELILSVYLEIFSEIRKFLFVLRFEWECFFEQKVDKFVAEKAYLINK